MNRNKINLEIFGVRTVALVDTGAAISCISEELYIKLKGNNPTNAMNIYGWAVKNIGL